MNENLLASTISFPLIRIHSVACFCSAKQCKPTNGQPSFILCVNKNEFSEKINSSPNVQLIFAMNHVALDAQIAIDNEIHEE